jgi:hypothetical protein
MDIEKDFDLDDLMFLESAAQRWPQLFTAIELRRAAHAGKRQQIQQNRKCSVTERDLMEQLRRKGTGAPRCYTCFSSQTACA